MLCAALPPPFSCRFKRTALGGTEQGVTAEADLCSLYLASSSLVFLGARAPQLNPGFGKYQDPAFDIGVLRLKLVVLVLKKAFWSGDLQTQGAGMSQMLKTLRKSVCSNPVPLGFNLCPFASMKTPLDLHRHSNSPYSSLWIQMKTALKHISFRPSARSEQGI